LADTVAPSVPASLVATTVSASQINLSWTASTDNNAVTGYRLERCVGVSCTAFSQVATPTTTTYSDSGLANATNYSYRVRATDAAGNLSGYSVPASAKTLDNQAPTAPSGLTATAASSSQINLSWTASTDNVGVTGYRVERCQASGCTAFAQIAAPTTTSYSDTGLSTVTSYSYRVLAVDAANNASGPSNTGTAVTLDTQAPTAPTGLTATAASSSQINLTWTASTDNVGVAGYRIERCQGSGCTAFAQIATPTTTSFSDAGLTAGTSYSYRVRASDAASNVSGYSATASATTIAPTDTTPPSTPGTPTASAASTSQINISWPAATDNVAVTGYRIERCQGEGCTSFSQIGTPTTTTFSDVGRATDNTYSYRIRAIDAANNLSGYSATVSESLWATFGSCPKPL
jgi:fibronectin type 3 domain-containing protein